MLLIALCGLVVVAVVTLVRSAQSRPGDRGSRGSAVAGFSLWALAGALGCLAVVLGFSIGLFFLPFAAALILIAAWTHREHIAELGLLVGIGAVLIMAGLAHDSGPSSIGDVVAGVVLVVTGSTAAFAFYRHEPLRTRTG